MMSRAVQADDGTGGGGPASTTMMARVLIGDLPCVRCRYNLRGLSIRGRCPECGALVRATILAVVDPRAGELRPLSMPRATAIGLTVWALSALTACVAVWVVRLNDVVVLGGWEGLSPAWVTAAPVWLIAASGVGAIVLIRPHGGIAPWKLCSVVIGVAAYAPLSWFVWRLHQRFDLSHARPYFQEATVDAQRILLRLAIGALLLIVLIGLRPNVRLLVSRSVLLRSGRVDRQTLLAMSAAVVLGMVGDGARLVSTSLADAPDLVRLGGTFCIVVSSLLLTLGLVGVVVDTLRLLPVILEPAPSLEQLVGAPTGADGQGAEAAS